MGHGESGTEIPAVRRISPARRTRASKFRPRLSFRRLRWALSRKRRRVSCLPSAPTNRPAIFVGNGHVSDTNSLCIRRHGELECQLRCRVRLFVAAGRTQKTDNKSQRNAVPGTVMRLFVMFDLTPTSRRHAPPRKGCRSPLFLAKLDQKLFHAPHSSESSVTPA